VPAIARLVHAGPSAIETEVSRTMPTRVSQIAGIGLSDKMRL
jgi:hypothetical protein